MGGHHDPELPKIPDWRIYRVEDVPQLMKVKKALAQHGLTDPWLRNEVWKYTEFLNKGNLLQKIWHRSKVGFRLGLAAAIITAAVEYAFFPLRKAPSEEEHGHH